MLSPSILFPLLLFPLISFIYFYRLFCFFSTAIKTIAGIHSNVFVCVLCGCECDLTCVASCPGHNVVITSALINRCCGNWKGQVSRTIGSPLCSIRLLCSIPRFFSASTLYFNLSSPSPLPSSLSPFLYFFYFLSLLLTITFFLLTEKFSLFLLLLLLFCIRAQLQNFWLTSLPHLHHLTGQTDSWLQTRGGAFDLHSLLESTAASD